MRTSALAMVTAAPSVSADTVRVTALVPPGTKNVCVIGVKPLAGIVMSIDAGLSPPRATRAVPDTPVTLSCADMVIIYWAVVLPLNVISPELLADQPSLSGYVSTSGVPYSTLRLSAHLRYAVVCASDIEYGVITHKAS